VCKCSVTHAIAEPSGPRWISADQKNEFGFKACVRLPRDEPDRSGYEARAGFLRVGLMTLPLLKLQIDEQYSTKSGCSREK